MRFQHIILKEGEQELNVEEVRLLVSARHIVHALNELKDALLFTQKLVGHTDALEAFASPLGSSSDQTLQESEQNLGASGNRELEIGRRVSFTSNILHGIDLL